jgi:hypothetical protein
MISREHLLTLAGKADERASYYRTVVAVSSTGKRSSAAKVNEFEKLADYYRALAAKLQPEEAADGR